MTVKTITETSKAGILLSELTNGKRFTFSKAEKALGIGNLRAEATRLRQAGYVVNCARRTAKNGVKVSEYTLGEPTRELIAAGYRAIQLGLV